MSKTILTLDQSSHISGYAIFIDNILHAYGKFAFEDAELDVRLNKVRNKIKELINQYQPDLVIYEDIQQQESIQTFKVLAEVYGVISELLQELRIPHESILATSWKSTLGIKGHSRAEQKKNAWQYVVNTYNIELAQDIVDAICIGEAYLKRQECAW